MARFVSWTFGSIPNLKLGLISLSNLKFVNDDGLFSSGSLSAPQHKHFGFPLSLVAVHILHSQKESWILINSAILSSGFKETVEAGRFSGAGSVPGLLAPPQESLFSVLSLLTLKPSLFRESCLSGSGGRAARFVSGTGVDGP